MKKPLAVLALVLASFGLVAAVMAGRAWMRYSEEYSRAEFHLAVAKKALAENDLGEAAERVVFAQDDFASARKIAMVAPILVFGVVVLVPVGGVLYWKATRRSRPLALDEPRAPATTSDRRRS